MAMEKAVGEKVAAAIYIVWFVLMAIAFLPLILLSSLITDSGAQYFFAGMIAGATVYLTFFA
jgi:hypothetical protein